MKPVGWAALPGSARIFLNLMREARAHIVLRMQGALPVQSPEALMWVAVIAQAMTDAYISRSSWHGEDRWRADGERFFRDEPRLAMVCDAIGLDPEWVQDQAQIMRQVRTELEEQGYV